MRILLVEDDTMLGEIIAASLKDATYAVDWVQDGISATNACENRSYDLVLLDLGLPQKNGHEVLSTIRQLNDTPVIIISARDDLENRLAGLDGGADDFVVKPFDMSELLARIRAIFRRESRDRNPQLSAGNITLNPITFTATSPDVPQGIQLTNKEFSLLQVLLTTPGKIFSRCELEDKLYAWGEEPESNAIDFLIHSLRKKLGKSYIKNIRGAGWTVPMEQSEMNTTD